MFLCLDGGHSCIYPLPPVHLPFTLFPSSYLKFPKRSVFQELGVCRAWWLVALASRAWERQEGKRIWPHSFSLHPLSYLGRAWVDQGLRNWRCGHRKFMHEKARNQTENSVTLQCGIGEGRALDRKKSTTTEHVTVVPIDSLSVGQVAHWGHRSVDWGERCRTTETELRCVGPDICCNQSNERLKRKSLQRKQHKEKPTEH